MRRACACDYAHDAIKWLQPKLFFIAGGGSKWLPTKEVVANRRNRTEALLVKLLRPLKTLLAWRTPAPLALVDCTGVKLGGGREQRRLYPVELLLTSSIVSTPVNEVPNE